MRHGKRGCRLGDLPGVVYPAQCDHMGHMNVASYVAKFDEASWVFFCELGPHPFLPAQRPLTAWPAVQQNIAYRQELFAGDVIEVRSRVLEIADKRMRFEHVMYNVETRRDGRVHARSPPVHLDKARAQGLSRFPQPVRARREALLAGRQLDGAGRSRHHRRRPSWSRPSSPAFSAWRAA